MNTQQQFQSEAVEDVLFNDQLIGPTPGKIDWEKINNILAELLPLQQRMEAGMQQKIEPLSLQVKKIDARLEAAKNGDYLPRDEFLRLVELKKAAKARLNILWDHWNDLKDQCEALVGENKFAWRMYMQAKENDELEELMETVNKSQDWNNNEFMAGFDPEEIDNQAAMRAGQQETLDCLADEHIKEMRGLNVEFFNENPYLSRDWWDYSYQRRLENKALEKQALDDFLADF